MLTPALGSEYSYHLWFVVGAEAYNKGRLTDWSQVGFAAPDESTVTVTLNSPTPFLLRLMANHYSWWPLPLHAITSHGPLDQRSVPWTRAGRFVSSGPYRLVEWARNQRIAVERNPHYWDADRVQIDRIEFYPTENITAEEAMFRTGRLVPCADPARLAGA